MEQQRKELIMEETQYQHKKGTSEKEPATKGDEEQGYNKGSRVLMI